MRAFFAGVAGILFLIPRMVWATVVECGRVVRRLIADPAQPRLMPAAQVRPDPEISEAPVEDLGRVMAIREVAQAFLRGQFPAPAAVDLIEELDDEWLEVLDDEQLRRVATASPAALKLHLAGTPVRGLLRYDRRAIDDYRRARERPVVSVIVPEAQMGLAA